MIKTFSLAATVVFCTTFGFDVRSQCELIDIKSDTETLNSLNAIHFFDADLGFIAGDNGVVLKTEDGGSSWAQQTLTYGLLNGIHFFSKSIGITYTQYAIFRTTDGGDSWTALDISFQFKFMDFTSEGKAIAITLDNKVAVSGDKGESWTITDSFNPDVEMRGIKVIEDGLFYAWTKDAVYKSINGGEQWSWLADIQSSYLSYIFFIDKDNWIMEHSLGSGVELVYTADAGKTFKAYSYGYDIKNFARAYFFSANLGFILSGDNTDNYKYHLLKSTDGGKKWKEVEIETATWNRSDNAIYFVNSKLGFLVNSMGGIAKSTDGGETWRYLTDPKTYFYSKLLFVGDGLGFMVGEGGSISKTTDSGNSWKTKYADTKLWNTDVSFPTDRVGYVSARHADFGINEGSVLKSIDGGANWSVILETDFHVNGVFFLSEEVGFIVGDGGTVHRTTNGGKTWQGVETGADTHLKFIQFVNNNVGFASGGGNRTDLLLKTTDGGASWSTEAEGFWEETYSMFFLNENTGYIGAGYGLLYKTTDGGKTFQEFRAASFGDYQSIKFISNEVGFIADGNQVNYTYNGGANWAKITVPTSSQLTSIDYSGDNTLLIAGRAGAIIKMRLPIPFEEAVMNGNANACVGESSYKIENPLGYMTEYWLEDGGDLTVEDGKANVVWNKAGKFILYGKLFTDCGRSNIAELEVVVTDQPDSIEIVSGEPSTCLGKQSYKVAGVNGLTYHWELDHGGKLEADGEKAVVKWSVPGKHEIRVFASNRCGDGPITSFEVEAFDAKPDLPTISLVGAGLLMSSSEVDNQWYLNGEKIEGATGRMFQTDLASGIFTVEIENPCGRTFSDEFKYSNVLGTQATVEAVQVYPNPASEFIHLIIHGDITNFSYELVDIAGVVRSAGKDVPISNSSLIVPIGGLPVGVYLVKLKYNDSVQMRRIIIE